MTGVRVRLVEIEEQRAWHESATLTVKDAGGIPAAPPRRP